MRRRGLAAVIPWRMIAAFFMLLAWAVSTAAGSNGAVFALESGEIVFAVEEGHGSALTADGGWTVFGAERLGAVSAADGCGAWSANCRGTRSANGCGAWSADGDGPGPSEGTGLSWHLHWARRAAGNVPLFTPLTAGGLPEDLWFIQETYAEARAMLRALGGSSDEGTTGRRLRGSGDPGAVGHGSGGGSDAPVGVGWRRVKGTEAHGTRDVVALVDLLTKDGEGASGPPAGRQLVLGLAWREVAYDALDVTWPLWRTSRFALTGRASLLSAGRWTEFVATGRGVAEADGGAAFYFDLASREADGGWGWAAGLQGRFEAKSFVLTVEGVDVVGRIYRPEIVSREGFANSRQDVIGPDGHVTFVPLFRGRYRIESGEGAPLARWTWRMERKAEGVAQGVAPGIAHDFDGLEAPFDVEATAETWFSREPAAGALTGSRLRWHGVDGEVTALGTGRLRLLFQDGAGDGLFVGLGWPGTVWEAGITRGPWTVALTASHGIWTDSTAFGILLQRGWE